MTSWLNALEKTVLQLHTVINRVVHLNLTRSDRLAVVASKFVATSLAVLINKEPDLLQAAVMRMAPLTISTLVENIEIAVESLVTRRLAQSLDPIMNLPSNGTSTDILVLEESQSGYSAIAAFMYVTALQSNDNNTGLALLDVASDKRPKSPNHFLKSPSIEPFLLRTLCPTWLANGACT